MLIPLSPHANWHMQSWSSVGRASIVAIPLLFLVQLKLKALECRRFLRVRVEEGVVCNAR